MRIADRDRRRPSGGFTLVELVVVIGVIALLVALIFPTFQSVRRAANRASCASSLRQMGIAFEAYANTYRGKLPAAVHCVGNVRLPRPAGGERRWSDLIAEFASSKKDMNVFTDITSVRGQSVIWGCPEWRANEDDLFPSDAVRTGYAMSRYGRRFFQESSSQRLYTDWAYISGDSTANGDSDPAGKDGLGSSNNNSNGSGNNGNGSGNNGNGNGTNGNGNGNGNGSGNNGNGNGTNGNGNNGNGNSSDDRGTYIRKDRWAANKSSEVGYVIDSMTHFVFVPGYPNYAYSDAIADGWQPGPDPKQEKSLYTNNGKAFYVDAGRHLKGGVTRDDHERGMNMLYLDGHVSPVSVSEAWTAITGKPAS
jgi:prepilin-type processing-associated H-X9-DG protein